jgi:hypothetical protein
MNWKQMKTLRIGTLVRKARALEDTGQWKKKINLPQDVMDV